MNFKSATDELLGSGVTLPEIAIALGVAYTTVRAFRLDPGSSSYRTPPEGWRARLARLARQRADDLVRLAEEIERDPHDDG